MNHEKVLDLGQKLAGLIHAIESANKNIEAIDNDKFLEMYDGCDTHESRAFFLRRIMRQSIGELFEFGAKITDDDIMNMVFPMSVCCFSQDWDMVFESVTNGTDNRDFEFVNDTKAFDEVVKVKNWGLVDPRFDVKFLKHMRNGIAHSKYEYDFDKQQIELCQYRGSFVVDMPMKFFAGLPESIWGLAENSNHESAVHRINLLGKYPFDSAFSVVVKNNFDLAEKPKIKLKKETKEFLDNVRSKIEGGLKMPLIGRLRILQIAVEFEMNVDHNMTKSDQKRVLDLISYLGFDVLEAEELDVFFHVHKSSEFLSAVTDYLFSTEIEKMSIDDRKKAITQVLSIRVDDRNKNFYPYFFTYMMMRTLKSKSQGGFAKNFMATAVPYVLDEVQEFVERSYMNFCFNYAIEKFGIPHKVLEKSIESVFGDDAVIWDKDVKSFLSHMRNSVVHPTRAVKSGSNYMITDKKKGEVSFFAELDTKKLMDYAGFVLDACVSESKKEDTKHEKTM